MAVRATGPRPIPRTAEVPSATTSLAPKPDTFARVRGPRTSEAPRTSVITSMLHGAQLVLQSLFPNAPKKPSWFSGFLPQPRELHGVKITKIEGEIPRALNGTFYRNGPGAFGEVSHVFDADGMVARFHFDDGAITFSNRFVQTSQRLEEEAAGARLYRGFGSPLPGGVPGNAIAGIDETANTSVLPFGDKLLAMAENGRPYALDPETLETIGEHDFNGTLGPHTFFSAHPKVLADGTAYNFGMAYGPLPAVNLWRIDPSGSLEKLPRLPLRHNTMMHDFAATKNHVVVLEHPYRAGIGGILKMFAGQDTLANALAWHGDDPMTVHVMDKSGAVKRFETPPDFIGHTVNAFEDKDGNVCVDYLGYKDDAPYRMLQSVLDAPPTLAMENTLTRLVISRSGVEKKKLARMDAEFPQINPRYAGRDYQFLYAVKSETGAWSSSRLVKTDVKSGQTSSHDFGAGHFPGEPIFVPKPDAVSEDDGWLLSVVYDATTHGSYVAVLDAAHLSLLAKAHLPIHLPVGFHGAFRA